MKLVSISHIRCGEWDATTYVLAPDEWKYGHVSARVEAAKKMYLEEVSRVRKLETEGRPPDPGYQPNFKAHPDRLVSDVAAEHAEARAVYTRWLAKRRSGQRSFESFLVNQGFSSLGGDDADAQAVKVEVDWGHRHGEALDYSGVEIDTMPTPARLVGADDDEREDLV